MTVAPSFLERHMCTNYGRGKPLMCPECMSRVSVATRRALRLQVTEHERIKIAHVAVIEAIGQRLAPVTITDARIAPGQ